MNDSQTDADASATEQTTFVQTTPEATFPGTLMSSEQWLVWKHEARDGEQTKVPYSPTDTSVQTGTASPDGWTDFMPAYRAYNEQDDVDGIGFVFTDDDPYVGIDLDYVVSDGTMDDWAWETITTVSSFTELSPSGTGAHIIARGELDPDFKQRNDDLGIEMYETNRFFTMTGDVLVNADDTVQDRSESVLDVQHELLDERQQRGDTVSLTDWDRSEATRTPDREESDMIDFMSNVNDKFERLHNGSNSGYNSPSEADQAYFQQLAWLTANDPTLMEKLARSSSRVRPKWDESRGSTTWLRRDIQEAISQTSSTCNKFQ